MQGRVPKIQQEEFVYLFSLEDRVPKDHILRQIKPLIDEDYIAKEAESFFSEKGRPSIPPEMAVKILLLGSLKNARSIRGLMKEISVNLADLWFLDLSIDDPIPDHSTISKAQTRLGKDFFLKILLDVIDKCRLKGLISGEKLFMDATYIEANASKDSVVDRQKFEKEKVVVELSKFIDDIGKSEKKEKEEKKGKKKPKKPVNEVKVSKTAPDASIISRNGKDLGLKYKAHIGVDGGEHRIITSFSLSPGAVSDESKLPDLVYRHSFICHKKPNEIGADKKYGTVENLRFLEDHNIRQGMPYRGDLDRKDFEYDRKNDCFICKKGEILKFGHINRSKQMRVYQCYAPTCRNCSEFGKCTKSKKGRRVRLPVDHDLIRRVIAYGKSAPGRRTGVQRSSKAEGAISDLKCNLGLKRMRSRDNEKVDIQFLVAITAYDLRKLAKESRNDNDIGAKALIFLCILLIILIFYKFQLKNRRK